MITINNLSKEFKIFEKPPGLAASLKSLFKREYIRNYALKDVSLEIPQGQITGLVGANGAGKTTLVKILTGIISASSGEARVLGFNPWERKNEFRRNISLIMGQKAQLWWDLPAADCFLLLKDIYEIPKAIYNETLEQLAEMLEVSGQLNTQIRKLSLGERMKMELIAALLHNPKVIFLDEPTIGLDITSQKTVRNFLISYREKHNATIILTSHYMEDIEALCERVLILNKGQLVFDGRPADISSQNSTKVISFTLDGNFSADELSQRLGGIDSESFIENHNGSYKLRVDKPLVPKILPRLLTDFQIEDLLIEEDDISVMIEKIMRGQLSPAAIGRN